MGEAARKGKTEPQKDGATMPTPEDSATPAETATPQVEETEASTAADAAAGEAGAETPAAQAGSDEADGEPQDADEAQADEAEKAEAVTDEAAEDDQAAEEMSDEDGSGPLGAELEMLRKQLDEAQVDIKRVAAEYKNYRDRVKRDQAAAAEIAVAGVLSALLPVLDDLDRARDHGDLTGPFGSVAEQLLAVVGKFGLTAFGAKGDAFDPKLHEAVAHLPSPDVTEETCIDVMRRGYMLGDRLLRPAMVAVAAPQE
ncbi:MAG: nucleotide exchange factor GrpE [Hamadaea sp.]|nr:nucleotide exchange factor GrpE [Hamadaea sp.]